MVPERSVQQGPLPRHHPAYRHPAFANDCSSDWFLDSQSGAYGYWPTASIRADERSSGRIPPAGSILDAAELDHYRLFAQAGRLSFTRHRNRLLRRWTPGHVRNQHHARPVSCRNPWIVPRQGSRSGYRGSAPVLHYNAAARAANRLARRRGGRSYRLHRTLAAPQGTHHVSSGQGCNTLTDRRAPEPATSPTFLATRRSHLQDRNAAPSAPRTFSGTRTSSRIAVYGASGRWSSRTRAALAPRRRRGRRRRRSWPQLERRGARCPWRR